MLHEIKTDWYCKQQPLQQTIIVPTRTIINPFLDIIIIIYLQDIPKNLCSSNQAKKSIKRHPIIITDANYDYIWDEIERREKDWFERYVSANIDEEYY